MDSMKVSFGDNTQSRWDMLKNVIRSVYYYILLDVHYKKSLQSYICIIEWLDT